MKPTEFIVENSTIAQEADDMHRDHEVQMARSQMYSSAQAAIEIHRLLRDISEMEGLEGWVQSKLTLASQYLESVRDYLKYEAVSQESEMMAFAESAADYAIESLLAEDDDMQVRKPAGDYVDPDKGYAASTRREKIMRAEPDRINPMLQKHAERSTPRAYGDPGVPGAKEISGPRGIAARDFTNKGLPMGGGSAVGVARPEGVPKVSRTPITRFSMPGSSDHDPRLGADLDPKSMMMRSNNLKERIHYLERRIKEQAAGAAPQATQATPPQQGLSKATAPTGDVTTSFNQGGISASQTQTPGGYVKQQTADMDLGPQGSVGMVKAAPTQPGQLAGTTTVTRTAMPTIPGQGSATAATGTATQGVAFGGASGKNVGNNVVTSGDTDLAQQAKQVMPVSEYGREKRNRVKESATGGSSSSSGMAVSVSGPGYKTTSGVPKRLGNSHKDKKVAVGKGIYDK